jgi:hypothetical protein
VLEAEWIRQLVADIFGLPAQFQGAALLANISTCLVTWQHVSQHQEEAKQEATRQPGLCKHISKVSYVVSYHSCGVGDTSYS